MYYSFIMLKPDALKRELIEPIMQYFKQANIEIERLGYKKVDEALLCTHYAHVIEKYGEDFKRKLMVYFEGQPTLPMIVKGENENLIAQIREIVGATNPAAAAKGTIRGDLGIDSYEKCGAENRSCENLIHASDSTENAKAEIANWFGEEVAALYFA